LCGDEIPTFLFIGERGMTQLWQTIRVEQSDRGVRTITLDRPERLNAVNPAMARELPAALDAAQADDSVRVVVLAGAGRAFCAGLDLADPAGLDATTRAEQLDDLAWVGRWVLAVRRCEKPVIAALHGVAAGAGFGLALAADIRIMSDAATLTAGYIRRGLSPDAGVSWFLPRLVGVTRATDILLTGRDVGPEEAERIGLVTTVSAAADFSATVASYADQLAAGAPIAQALTKRVLGSSLEQSLGDQLRDELLHIRRCFASADVSEALIAFREKRAPKFEGR
jgi:2-(1,2-epoxy-1,2-dihydrophenyl)acetyl-CoA isomerase